MAVETSTVDRQGHSELQSPVFIRFEQPRQHGLLQGPYHAYAAARRCSSSEGTIYKYSPRERGDFIGRNCAGTSIWVRTFQNDVCVAFREQHELCDLYPSQDEGNLSGPSKNRQS